MGDTELQQAGAQKRKRFETLTDWARDRAWVILEPMARVLSRLGLHPNTITLLGFGLSVGVGVLVGTGHLGEGGWLLLVAGVFDALDGALARFNSEKTRFGAFLDSTMDRLCEAAVLLGLTVHYTTRGSLTGVLLASVTLVASFMVSYTRARAEGLGVTCKVGLLTRVERFLVLVPALILNQPTAGLWILAVLVSFTVLQRILHVWRATRGSDCDDG